MKHTYIIWGDLKGFVGLENSIFKGEDVKALIKKGFLKFILFFVNQLIMSPFREFEVGVFVPSSLTLW
jgi:hypothetical protein